MVWATEVPIPLHPTGKKIGLPEPRTAASVEMLKLLSGGIRELYSRKSCLEEPDQEELNKTRKYILVKEGEYAQLIQKLCDTGIVELFLDKPEKINGILDVVLDGVEKRTNTGCTAGKFIFR